MLKALLALVGAIVSRLRSAALLEAAGAGLIVFGVYQEWGSSAAVIAGGSALVLKAFELDGRSR